MPTMTREAVQATRERHAVTITFDTALRAHRATCCGPDCHFDKCGDYATLTTAAVAHETRPATT